MDCITCDYAKRNEFGVFEDMCSGSGNCSYAKYTGVIGELINNDKLNTLFLGNKVKVVWKNPEEVYYGVIFGNKIGYDNGKFDSINIITDHVNRGFCKVYLLGI